MRKILPWLITLVGCFLVTGALAAVKETTLEILSKIPFGLYAAKEPIKIAPTRAIDIATAAKDKVTGIASNTMSIAGLSFLSE